MTVETRRQSHLTRDHNWSYPFFSLERVIMKSPFTPYTKNSILALLGKVTNILCSSKDQTPSIPVG